jgi:glycosyltransferase involved in cell wall biosynthesis
MTSSRATILVEGPFETDYSLATVNRNLTRALLQLGEAVAIHQRDNTTAIPFSETFPKQYPELASHTVPTPLAANANVHSRYIYPPYCDSMWAPVRSIHCFGWEESTFPARHSRSFNHGLELVTVMSNYVRQVLRDGGVTVPVEVCGLGADHILEADAQPYPQYQPGPFTFVHVSSCFPRKAVDTLVEAYCSEFDRSDDVRLLIKTFPNPHNNVEAVIRESAARHPRHAPIELIWEPLPAAQMRFLLENANCLVSPSRGEGFGLPVAEAMLLGCPVIATIHSGQADTCSPSWCWPVDFTLQPARTHLSEAGSLWAEPSVVSLRGQMRKLLSTPRAEIERRTTLARRHIEDRFTWKKVAQRHLGLWNRSLEQRAPIPRSVAPRQVRHVGFVSTWNTRCGIAEYTRYVIGNLGDDLRYTVFAAETADRVRPDGEEAVRCWDSTNELEKSWDEAGSLARAIAARKVDLVWVQFNFAFFAPEALDYLIDEVHRAGLPIFVTVHATNNERFVRLAAALRKADLTIVHREQDVRLLAAERVERVILQQHGVLAPPFPGKTGKPRIRSLGFTVASFGFFLDKKGIHELLVSFAAALHNRPGLRLKLLTSLYPIPESAQYAASCLKLARDLGIASHLTLSTRFLDQATVLDELHSSDLIVLPYVESTESASGAIRLPLASGTPILCSNVSLFDEFAGAVHRYPVGDRIALANAIVQLAADPDKLHQFSARQREIAEEFSWPRVCRRFREIIHNTIESGSGTGGKEAIRQVVGAG